MSEKYISLENLREFKRGLESHYATTKGFIDALNEIIIGVNDNFDESRFIINQGGIEYTLEELAADLVERLINESQELVNPDLRYPTLKDNLGRLYYFSHPEEQVNKVLVIDPTTNIIGEPDGEPRGYVFSIDISTVPTEESAYVACENLEVMVGLSGGDISVFNLTIEELGNLEAGITITDSDERYALIGENILLFKCEDANFEVVANKSLVPGNELRYYIVIRGADNFIGFGELIFDQQRGKNYTLTLNPIPLATHEDLLNIETAPTFELTQVEISSLFQGNTLDITSNDTRYELIGTDQLMMTCNALSYTVLLNRTNVGDGKIKYVVTTKNYAGTIGLAEFCFTEAWGTGETALYYQLALDISQLTSENSFKTINEESIIGSGNIKIVGVEEFVTPYSNASTYAIGDLVSYDGSFYLCKTAISVAEDFDLNKWVETKPEMQILDLAYDDNPKVLTDEQFALIASNLCIIRWGNFRIATKQTSYNSTFPYWAYSTGSYMNGDDLQELRITIQSNKTWTYNQYNKPIALLTNLAPSFDSHKTYAVGDACIHNWNLYKCITAITVAGDWDDNKWTETTVAELIADAVNNSHA